MLDDREDVVPAHPHWVMRVAEVDENVLISVPVAWGAVASDDDLVLAIPGDLARAAGTVRIPVTRKVQASARLVRAVAHVDRHVLGLGWDGKRVVDIELVLQHRELKLLVELLNVDPRCEEGGALDVAGARVGSPLDRVLKIDGATVDGNDLAVEAYELHVEGVVHSKPDQRRQGGVNLYVSCH